MHGVSGEFGAPLAEFAPRPHIVGWKGTVAGGARRTQQHPAAGVKRVVAAHVRASTDCPHERIDFGFAEWVIATARHLGAPTRWEVAVHVEPLRWPRRGHGEPVVLHHVALVEEAIALHRAIGSLRRHRCHQPRVERRRHPRSVGVGDAHGENASVAIDVAFMQTGCTARIAPWPRAGAAAAKQRSVGQGPLDTVGVHPRHDVERASLQRAGDRGVGAETRDQAVDDGQRRHTSGEFHRVDVRVYPVRRFGVVGSG